MTNIGQRELKPKKKGKKKKKKKNKKAKAGEANILNQSMEVDGDAKKLKYEQIREMKKKLFVGIEAEKALYLFGKDSKARKLIYRRVTDSSFETVILVLIVFSSIKLIYDTYLWEEPVTDPRVVWSERLDLFFTAAFALESLLKSIAFGFFMD